ncbi:MAG: hypothetical protein D6B25_14860 [Desulfobulbaceae bacterium]|nr:MAG: hypothetical protein D6B25_14860 [Desulfobulbaceae bacterium]
MSNINHPIAQLSVLIFFLLTPISQYDQASAQSTISANELDEILGDLSSEPLKVKEGVHEPSPQANTPRLQIHGSLQEFVSIAPINHTSPAGFEVNGLQAVQTRLELLAAMKLTPTLNAVVSGWGFFDIAYGTDLHQYHTDSWFDQPAYDFELDETYVSTKLSAAVDFSFGRQITRWGKADLFRVNDIWHTDDNREVSLLDSWGTRQPILSSKLAHASGQSLLSLIIAHEFREEKPPVFGSDFYPYKFPLPSLEHDYSNTFIHSAGVEYKRSFPAIDVSISAASFLKEYDYIGLTIDSLKRKIARVGIIGAGFEIPYAQWLFKSEIAYLTGLEYYSLNSPKDRFDILVGFDYLGFENTTLSFEVVNRHITDFTSALASLSNTPEKNTFLWGFRFSRFFLRNRLNATFFSLNGGIDFKHGSVQKLSFRYDFTDAYNLTFGVLLFAGGETFPTEEIGNNDRIILKFTYNF